MGHQSMFMMHYRTMRTNGYLQFLPSSPLTLFIQGTVHNAIKLFRCHIATTRPYR